ncbi:MAG: type VI secretion system tube protein Hcp [Hamadaea sp.]|nr:type VI secretion system tube protein Hcp [Hamadaea sp.]
MKILAKVRRHVVVTAVGAAAASLLLTAGLPAAAETEPGAAGEEQAVVATCPQPPQPPAAAASVDYLLRIDGIPGESAAVGYEGAMEVMSYSWGVSQGAYLTCAPQQARRAYQPLLIRKRLDKASPLIFQQVAAGTHAPKASLHVRKAGTRGEAFLTYELEDVVISSYSTGAGPDLTPADSFALTYGRLRYAYRPQKQDGTLDTAVVGCWDVRANRTCPAIP